MTNSGKFYYYFESGKVAISEVPLTIYEIAELEAQFGMWIFSEKE